jgi:hypothetical protein
MTTESYTLTAMTASGTRTYEGLSLTVASKEYWTMRQSKTCDWIVVSDGNGKPVKGLRYQSRR